MPKPDEVVAEVGGFTVFRKSDSREYEIVGPAAKNSPLAYSFLRVTPEKFNELNKVIREDAKRVEAP